MKKLFYIFLIVSASAKAQIITGAQYSISPKQISDSIKNRLHKDSLAASIGTVGSLTKAASEYSVREALNGISVLGLFRGSSNTFAGLSAITPKNTNDLVSLTATDGTNVAGLYAWNGTTFALVKAIPDIGALTNLDIQNIASTVQGTISGQRFYSGWQKHWNDSALKGTAALLDNGTDVVNRLWSAGELQNGVNASVRRLALSNWDATFAGYGRPDLPGGEAGDLPYTTRNGKTYMAIIANVAVGADPSTDAVSWVEMYDKEILRGAVAPTGTPATTAKFYIDTVARITYGALSGSWTQIGSASTVTDGYVNFQNSTTLITQLNSTHPLGGTVAARVKDNGAIADVTIGANITADSLMKLLAVNNDVPAKRVIRQTAAVANTQLAGTDLISQGFYRLWIQGLNVNIKCVDCIDGAANSSVVYAGATPPTPAIPAQSSLAVNNTTKKVDRFWNPTNSSWELLGGTTNWYKTTSGTNTWFKKWLTRGTLASLTFDFSDPADDNVVSTFTISDFTTGFSASGFYGGTAKFTDVVMSSGRTVKVVIAVYSDNAFLINILNSAGTANGRISNIKLTTTTDATVYPVDHSLVAATAPPVVPAGWTNQIVYHAGNLTGITPQDPSRNAIAINTTTNVQSHWWDVGLGIWVDMAAVPVNNTVSARSAIGNAQTNTVVSIGDLQFRYSSNATNGNLDVRFNTAGGGAISWCGRKNMAAGGAVNSIAINGNSSAYTTLSAGNMGINESLTYYVYNLTFAYEVKLINRADQQIYINVTRLNN